MDRGPRCPFLYPFLYSTGSTIQQVTLRQETLCEPITDKALLSLMSDTSSSIKRSLPVQPATGRDGRFFTMLSTEVDLMLSVPPSHLTHSWSFVEDSPPPHLMRSQSLTDLNSLSPSSGDGEDNAFDKVHSYTAIPPITIPSHI